MPSRAQLVTLLALASTRAQGPDEVVITEGPGYRVQFDVVTKAGPSKFVVHVRQEWAPYAAARFLELVRAGHFDDSRFMIVVPDRFTHFGISGDPQKQAARLLEQIKPEETAAVAKRNTAGRIAFVPSSDASAAPKSKTKKTMGLDKINMPEVSWGEKDGAGSTRSLLRCSVRSRARAARWTTRARTMCLTRRTFLRQSSSSLSAFSGVMPSLVYAGSRAEEGGEEVGGVDDAIVTERRDMGP